MSDFNSQAEILDHRHEVLSDHIAVSNYLQAESESEVVDAIFRGLSAAPKYISSRFFYDATGSRLFEGVTARFNKNILQVVNQIAGTNFDPLHFQHLTFFNYEQSRIEMRLKALKEQVIFSSRFPETLTVKKGETIHTENSRKFSNQDIRELANVADLSIRGIYNDQKEYFSLLQLICTE